MARVIRKMDDLGRVVLPGEVKDFGWTEGTLLEITAENESVSIRASESHCKLCGAAGGELIPVERGLICENCLHTALDILATKQPSKPGNA